ncbi:MAG TPA: oxygen-independent coproporphyrinogen III oxidase [Balneolaceae bacterium]|nr:oxygen-independent coproporphyrinogen III oxidase [Balneolaceae bacterium]
MEFDLIKKYNVQGPRYTSYPTAAQLRATTDEQITDLHGYLLERNSNARPISLYFHIPFCFSLCWYCGCTKIITKDTDRGNAYLDYLEKEMDLLSKFIHPGSEVVQIHFGGGTPTFLKTDQLKRLGDAISERFNLTEETEFSVEIDPRRCSREQIETLAEIGCNRASLGVQDTNEDVQKAIHRIQPFEQTKTVTEWLRENGITSINFDLIYGLPRQTSATFRQTMDDVLTLMPDRLAVYSYAHIPELMPSQKLLKTEDFPSADEKLGMLTSSINHLTGNGYRFIGMDHFSRRDEKLAKAMDDGTLQRNFQGYSTKAGADLYAFGMSGISTVGKWFWQNAKDISAYYRCLDENKIPVTKSVTLNDDDFIRRDVIMNIMCRMGVSFSDISEEWGIYFKQYFHRELNRLKPFEDDHLITITGSGIRIKDTGRLFLRNIAMCFDYYLNQAKEEHQFSQTV